MIWKSPTGNWCRNCPSCNGVIIHTGSVAFWHARKSHENKLKCRRCQHQKFVGKTGNKALAFRGHGEVPMLYFTITKASAENRSLEFDLTIQDMANQFDRQKGKCSLTGLALRFQTCCGKKRQAGTASLDRINSERGYIRGNIQWVHKDINKMKERLPQSRFVELCKLVANKH